MDRRLVYAVALVIGSWVLAAKGLKISSNIPVGALNTSISRAGCGEAKVCLEAPADCDPSGDGTCLFVSAALASTNRANTNIELRGDSENYIVLVTSFDKDLGGGDLAYVCAQYNGTLHFFTTTYDNGSLTLTNMTEIVSNVLASFNDSVIQCTFTVLGSSEAASPAFYLFAGNGNFSDGVLGNPEITLMSNGSVDLNSTNMSSPSQNMTNSNMSSTSQNMTSSNMSSPSQNMNTIPVGALNAAISRDTCGQTKLCEEVPADCDPSGNGDCLFVSATIATTTRLSGINIAFELRGNTSGYVALILSPDMIQGGGDESFVCAQFNNTLHFFTATFDNGSLTITNRTGAVSNALASLNGTVIRCTFTALGLNATTRGSMDSSFYIFAATGIFNGVSLEDPVIRLSSNGSLDLTNSTSNLSAPAGNPTTPAGNTPTPEGNTTAGGAGLHPTSLVLLVLLSAFISRLV